MSKSGKVHLVGAGPGDLGLVTLRAKECIENADVIIYGHTHRPLVTRHNGRLFVNPGAAGPRRFDISPNVGRLIIAGGRAEVEIIDLA